MQYPRGLESNFDARTGSVATCAWLLHAPGLTSIVKGSPLARALRGQPVTRRGFELTALAALAASYRCRLSAGQIFVAV